MQGNWNHPGSFLLAVSLLVFSAVAANAQGIGEYGGLMGMPKPVPNSNTHKKMLDKIYTAPGRAASGAASAASAAGATSGRTPGTIKSGDVTDGSGAARAQLQQISKQAQSSFEQAKKFQKEGNLKEAEKFYLHSLKVRETYWKAIDPIIPEIYDALASIYAENGKTDQSEKALKEMLASYARLHGPGSKHRIKPLKALGDIYASANELWDSHDHYEQALVLSERYDGADSPQALELRLLVAGKLKDLGKSDRAADLFEKSLKLNNDKDYLTNDQIVETLDSYAVVLKKLNKTKEAENMQNQANQLRADGKTPTLEDSVEKVPADDKGASIKKTTDVE